MTSTGKTFKRCGCRNHQGQRLEQNCPRLAERGHGAWHFHCSAPNLFGRSDRIRRGGYPSQAAARQARDDILADSAARRTGAGWTVERWLQHWLDTRTRIRPTTRLHYTRDVELVLTPWLGHYRLSDLDGPLLRAVFAKIAQTTNSKGKPQSPSALNHLRTTLRAALNLAVREELIESNPARHIEIHDYRRPHAQVWTDGRVEHWELTGEHPSVAVWTAAQLATFLESVVDDSLYALWWLAALRGLRRGELCGLRWAAVDLDRGMLFVERQRTTAGYTVVEGEPKPPPGAAPSPSTNTPSKSCGYTAGISSPTATDNTPPARHGSTPGTCSPAKTVNRSTPATPPPGSGSSPTAPAYHPSGCTTCGTAPRPSRTRPVPTLKTLQDLLGHSSIVVTADTYTSVLPDSQRRCADATAALVLAAARHTRKRIKEKAGEEPARQTRRKRNTFGETARHQQTEPQVTSSPPAAPPRKTMTPRWHPRDTHRPHRPDSKKGPDQRFRSSDPTKTGAPEGTRTPNLLIRSAPPFRWSLTARAINTRQLFGKTSTFQQVVASRRRLLTRTMADNDPCVQKNVAGPASGRLSGAPTEHHQHGQTLSSCRRLDGRDH